MDADELRAIQAPIKDRYRVEPHTATASLRARGPLGSEAIACSIDTGRAMVEAGLDPASGADSSTERYCVVVQKLRTPPSVVSGRSP